MYIHMYTYTQKIMLVMLNENLYGKIINRHNNVCLIYVIPEEKN